MLALSTSNTLDHVLICPPHCLHDPPFDNIFLDIGFVDILWGISPKTLLIHASSFVPTQTVFGLLRSPGCFLGPTLRACRCFVPPTRSHALLASVICAKWRRESAAVCSYMSCLFSLNHGRITSCWLTLHMIPCYATCCPRDSWANRCSPARGNGLGQSQTSALGFHP